MNTTKTKDLNQMTPTQLITLFGGVSAAIRALDKHGYTRSEIATMLEKRYQHVRNILVTPVSKPKVKKQAEMSDEFKEALDKGL
jgi:hypothetical protein